MASNVERLGVEPIVREAVEEVSSAPKSIQMTQEQAVAAIKQIATQVATQVATDAARTKDAALIGTVQAIAAILAGRVILLLSVIGAFVLAVMAMDPAIGQVGLYVLIAYSVLSIIPLTILDAKSRKGNG